MTHEKMREMLSKDEKITIEYKECANQIHDSVYETVSAFSNRYGGYIIMGVKDGGIPIGVNRNAVKDLKKNFVNQLNNPNKMSPTLYLSIEEFEYEGMLLLYTYVPPTSTVEKCSGRVYDRNEEGDMDITDFPIQMENLYARKSNTYTESKLFPYVREEHLRTDLMEKVRRLISNNNPRHEWLKMSDKELLVSAGLYETDFVTGEQGYNLAAILLFGKDEVIQSCVPGYVTDALCRKENMDRYDDRLIVKTNLIESYEILMDNIKQGHIIPDLSVFEKQIIYNLRKMDTSEIAELPDVTEGLEFSIKKTANACNTISEFLVLIKSKRYTSTRIQRILLYSLLGITKKDMVLSKKVNPYVRVLGLNNKGKFMISEIANANPKLEIITSVKRFNDRSNNKNLKLMLDKDIFATNVYTIGYDFNSCNNLDFTKKIVTI